MAAVLLLLPNAGCVRPDISAFLSSPL